MTKDEALKVALEMIQDYVDEYGPHDKDSGAQYVITAIKEALAQQNQFNPDWDVMAVMVEEQQRMAKRIAELEAQPEQPKYRRGNRLVCLETDEYCVIHISGTDRQWVKFPDTYIGVYTNEQVAELFELLPKESEPWEKFCDSNCVWTDHHPDCKLAQPEYQSTADKSKLEKVPAKGALLAQSEQEPVANEAIWLLTSEYNDYDQHGEYFEAVYIGKPTSKQIQKHCHVTEQGAVHILNGGGRVKYEDQWYNLRKEKAAHGIKELKEYKK